MRKPEKIIDGVYLVGSQDLTDMRDCCVYLIDGGSELALVDTGVGLSGWSILDNIKTLGFEQDLLKYVIATHGHIDHTGGLSFFQSLGAKIVAHVLELDAISKGLPNLTAEKYYRLKYQPVEADLVLQGDRQDIQIGGLTLHCLLTPGHTPGGISPYVDLPGGRVLFGQDIHGPFNASWGSDLDKWQASMKKLIDLKADILCEGHFGVYRPAAKVRQYIEHYLEQYADG
ncbi:MAG: Metallo-beta-lactamase L1 precursor [Pelotomaculum sp. PtaB.Bin104]|nr:MAG: Metallo-beta-lactamase L1 precursor [Pelotomaculum sp. PtaB.Bin104]